MEQDHYTVLGVTPQSAQAAIRSAYLALMRRCHPDADPGGAAAEQARAINQAYSVLGDPRKRERYDSSLASMRALRFDPVAAERAPARRSRIGPAAAIGVTLLAAGMVAFAIMPPTDPARFPPFTSGGEEGGVRAPATTAAVSTERAADQMAGPTTARPSLDVPDLVPSERVVPTVETAEARAPTAKPTAAPPSSKPAVVLASASTPLPAQPQPGPANSNCSWASRRTDRMVCGDSNLSSLDRQLLLLYRQSWRQADEEKRAALLGTRQRFNDRREACSSSNCLTTAYVSRLKEISDIMAGRLQP